MDFYRINEAYNQFLQEYEKKKRGVTKVPNIRYTDRNKFAFGAVLQVILRHKEDIIFYISVSIVLKAVAFSNKLLIAFFKST